MVFSKHLIAVFGLSLLSGCASITKDSHQPIKIETYSKDNQVIEDVTCTAKNKRGEWSAEVPGVILAHRSGDNLAVKCEKENVEIGYGTLISRATAGMFGNILFGGGIGAIIDHSSGKAYSYPDWVRIIMGENLVFDRRGSKDNEVTTGKAANAEEIKKIQEEKVKYEEAARKAAAEKQETK
jgi:hypothetical protein